MDFSDLFMFYNNDDNGDGGDVRGSGGVRVFELLFCFYLLYYTRVYVLFILRFVVLLGYDFCFCGDDVGDNGILN